MMNLRKISLADSGFFFENLNDPEIKKSYNNIPDKITLDDIKQQIITLFKIGIIYYFFTLPVMLYLLLW